MEWLDILNIILRLQERRLIEVKFFSDLFVFTDEISMSGVHASWELLCNVKTEQ